MGAWTGIGFHTLQKTCETNERQFSETDQEGI